MLLIKSGFIKETTLKLNLIAGVVMEMGVAVSREVRAYDRSSGVFLAKTTSDVDGRYKLYLPAIKSYSIVSIDHKRVFNSVISDVVPK